MPPPVEGRRYAHFGPFKVDLQLGELVADGSKVKLQEQPLQILTLLIERPGELVTREEIRQKLWPNETFVDFEHSINTAVKKLRAALGDDPENPCYIETVPRHGYLFLAPVAAGEIREPPLRKGWLLAVAGGTLVAVVAALIALNVVGLRNRLLTAIGVRQSLPLPKIKSIAVLPLENLSRDPEQEYFADGMTEELITCLGKVSALRVISWTSVMQYKRTMKPLPQIARELNVDAVVEGAVLRSGDRVRITTQLIQTEPEKHLWANSYENELKDVLVMQDELARAIVSEIRIKLTSEDRTRLNSARPINPAAYEAYVKGRHFWDIYTPQAQHKCVQYYEQAIQEDPHYALAFADMAHCYDMLAFLEQPPAREYQQKARAAAQKALTLDGYLAEAHMIFADQKYWVDWDWAAGEAAFRRAMDLNPASVEVVSHYGYALQVQGRFGEALPLYVRAVQLDPLSPTINGLLAHALVNAHQDQRAMEQYNKMLELNPNDAGAYAGLGSLYEAAGRNDEAVSAYLKAASLSGESAERMEVFRDAYRAGGLQGYWKKRLDYMKERAKRERVSPWAFALSYAHAGEKEEALEWLKIAFQQHTPRLVWLKAERTLDPLHSDPRFRDLLRRMNFPP